jgi:lipopolysaccharide/colanic/teichoic acid biosynthesis glycosyltransferase
MSQIDADKQRELREQDNAGHRPRRRPVHDVAKRVFDVVAAATGLLILSPLFVAAAGAVRLGSPGPILFRQERVGRHFRPFTIYKFRTMVADADKKGGQLTASADPRITRVGRWLRATKIDELPQLINVLKGDMSLVGPRPEVPRYVELFRKDYEYVLSVRPGLTDLASVKYRHEAALLAHSDNAEEEYVRRILPDKIALARQYIDRSSVWGDIGLLLRTAFRIVH